MSAGWVTLDGVGNGRALEVVLYTNTTFLAAPTLCPSTAKYTWTVVPRTPGGVKQSTEKVVRLKAAGVETA